MHLLTALIVSRVPRLGIPNRTNAASLEGVSPTVTKADG